MSEFIKKVSEIQTKLKAPKSQFNKFGNYAYRNCEDILEALKPLLNGSGLVLTVTDEIVEVGGRVYVKATSTITDGENSLSNSALAREAEEQKGMNDAQITGSSSSYARKYSLNGLFLIDDTKDADATNTHGKEEKQVSVVKTNVNTNTSEKTNVISNGKAEVQGSETPKKGFGVKKEAPKVESNDGWN